MIAFGSPHCHVSVLRVTAAYVRARMLFWLQVLVTGGRRQKEQARALLREVQILSRLEHPNIIKYLGTEYLKVMGFGFV